jgi:ParB family chromosome partitioning protein
VTEARNNRLLTDQELAESGPAEAVRIPIDLIDPNPRNPRAQMVELDALAENLKTFGLLQPVTVRRQGERYELVGGHRRLAAFAMLKAREPLELQWRTIPAVVRAFDDDDSYLALISSQVHSKSWKPREEAAALERLVVAGRNLRQIGESLNRTESWASKRLRVYADAVLSGYVQTGRLATGVAEELLTVVDVETRKELADRAVAEKWSQDQARGQVRALRLDKQLADLRRRARELVDLLSAVDPRRIPIDTTRDLWTLHGRIEVLARGAPTVPTIAEAEAAAGVTPKRRRATRRRRPSGAGT